jgi:nitrate/nitrite-specific signal transduction histidine kinase
MAKPETGLKTPWYKKAAEFHNDYCATGLSWAIMACSVVAALLLSYFSIKHLLKPIWVMNKVALEFGVSHCKQRVYPEGNDELATLGRPWTAWPDG